ncbi:hypothetical protein LSDV033 [Lumpy skin disease virus]|uniref:Uncharacterized protein n=1 Tax=Lumpy skin disease virus TaxID=59509 RepID=A0A8E7SMC1_LSDV|nr:hypothetical protein [Lumpy skin disease virus]QZZ09266.1 hypothetical protein LSDV033 [Lumpy skin disease virus]QZZ09417.1 hypothetical protein LSDV033 [Lumpy skin disease virus]QZZ09573.1 hypothetical protein LSDV033 [Lumpy skin disease virus]QZZ09729.1 hypothetical protein LSDV033 [Lumpy skin disease virus]
MFNFLIPLKEAFILYNCDNLTESYKKVNIDDAMKMLINGINPNNLPQKWYFRIRKEFPSKIYLFKPKTVPFVDLIALVYNQKNIELYREHINFHKKDIIKKCSKRIILKCIQYMVIADDDIFCLIHRFSNIEVENILTKINSESIKNINYLFSESLAEKIFINDFSLCDSLYQHQSFESKFLMDMLYKYGIIPNNDGILSVVSIELILDVLQSIKFHKDILTFLDMLTSEQLKDDRIKKFIITKIKNGEVDQYKTYAIEFLYDKKDELGLYYSFFFKDPLIDFTKYELTKDFLKICCKYIDNYDYNNKMYIINYLIEKNYINLLSTIIDKIPLNILTEELCIKIVCESNIKVKIKDIPIHSSLVMIVCIEMGYEDLVELLDTIDINVLLEKNANLVSDYTFSTDWYNKNNKLIDIFVQKYGFCSHKMNKLMFDYPLNKTSTMYLLNIFSSNNINKYFSYKIQPSLFYLSCTHSESNVNFILKKVSDIKNLIPFKKLPNKNSMFIYDQNKIKSLILYSNIPEIDMTVFKNMSYIEDSTGIKIQINKENDIILKTEEDILNQVFTIAKLTTYGLVYLPYRYFPSWVPIIDIIKGSKYSHPSKIEHGVIFKISPVDFIEYKFLGNYITNIYSLNEPISNFHSIINSFIQILFLYLVVGSTYSSRGTNVFISLLISNFFTGMKINETLTEDISSVCKELNLFKKYICDSGFVIIKKNYLKNTLLFCEKVCIFIILNKQK